MGAISAGATTLDRPAPLVVVAVGGNALIADPQRVTMADQERQAAVACEQLADLVAHGHRVLVTHGNGPQVGFTLRRSELARQEVPEVPLVYAVAESQGAIGFLLQQGLTRALHRRSLSTPVVTVVTRVSVDLDDPAFQRPTKPVGAHMDEARAQELAERFGWAIAEDTRGGWRRVVASPAPRAVLELAPIRHLLDAGYLIVAGGGGGVPVSERPDGSLDAVDAVVDKDATSSLLAQELDAAALVFLTDVDHVHLDHGTPDEQPLGQLTPAHAETLLSEGHFGAGSMAPKVRAAAAFARARPGAPAVIGDVAAAGDALRGAAGTRIVAPPPDG